MNQKKISETILEKIQEKNIKPRPKAYFIFKNFIFWVLFISAIILGSISFAIILFVLENTDFQILSFLDQSQGWQYFLSFLPFFWIFIIGMAVGIGVWGLRQTKKGYKIAFLTLLASNIFGSIVLGSFVYGTGGGEYLEEIFETKINAYQSVRRKHQRFWGNPEKNGRMGGVILAVEENQKSLKLEDPHGRVWEVQYESIEEKIKFKPRIGLPIKLKGSVKEGNVFIPDRMARARRHHRMNQKIQKYFQKHPEKRKKFKERGKRIRHGRWEERKKIQPRQ